MTPFGICVSLTMRSIGVKIRYFLGSGQFVSSVGLGFSKFISIRGKWDLLRSQKTPQGPVIRVNAVLFIATDDCMTSY